MASFSAPHVVLVCRRAFTWALSVSVIGPVYVSAVGAPTLAATSSTEIRKSELVVLELSP
jgi:hypothetical protein